MKPVPRHNCFPAFQSANRGLFGKRHRLTRRFLDYQFTSEVAQAAQGRAGGGGGDQFYLAVIPVPRSFPLQFAFFVLDSIPCCLTLQDSALRKSIDEWIGGVPRTSLPDLCTWLGALKLARSFLGQPGMSLGSKLGNQ